MNFYAGRLEAKNGRCEAVRSGVASRIHCTLTTRGVPLENTVTKWLGLALFEGCCIHG
jgi:hypothetical protein